MAIVSLADMKAHLNVTDDADDTLITDKIEAAQAHIENLLGYVITTKFPSPAVPPADLVEAVKQLAGHWYENREASIVGVSVARVPFSIEEIIRERREWSF